MEAFWDPPSNSSGEITSYVVRVQYYESRPGRFASLRKCRISDPAVRQWKFDPIPPQRPLYFQVQSVEHISGGTRFTVQGAILMCATLTYQPCIQTAI